MAKTRFEVYKDKVGTYRWRLLANNGESVAVGGEAYTSRNGAVNAAKKLKDWSKTKDIVDIEKEKELAMKEAQKAKAKKAKDVEKAKKEKAAKASKKASAPKKASKAKSSAKPKKVAASKVKKTTKAKPTNKAKKAAIPEQDVHIVKKEDRYDGLTVAEAIDNVDGDNPLM